MRHRFFTAFATAFLYLMTYGSAWATTPVSVWVALSGTSVEYVEAAQALRAELERTQPGSMDWRVAHWSRFDKSASRPKWIVAVGTAAQRGMQELFAVTLRRRLCWPFWCRDLPLIGLPIKHACGSGHFPLCTWISRPHANWN